MAMAKEGGGAEFPCPFFPFFPIFAYSFWEGEGESYMMEMWLCPLSTRENSVTGVSVCLSGVSPALLFFTLAVRPRKKGMSFGGGVGKVDTIWVDLFLFWVSGPLCCGPLSAALCSSWAGGGLVSGIKEGTWHVLAGGGLLFLGIFGFPGRSRIYPWLPRGCVVLTSWPCERMTAVRGLEKRRGVAC